MCAKCIPVPFLWSFNVKHTHTPVQHRIVSLVMVCAVLVNAASSAHIRLVYTYVNIHTRKCNITPLLLLKGFFFLYNLEENEPKKSTKKQKESNVSRMCFFLFIIWKKTCNIYIDNWECKCYVQNRWMWMLYYLRQYSITVWVLSIRTTSFRFMTNGPGWLTFQQCNLPKKKKKRNLGNKKINKSGLINWVLR